MTGCECPQAGWCARHRCHKHPQWHALCRTNAGFFRLWEEGRGPGQIRPGEPGLVQKGIHFAAAAARHLANGCRQVSDEVYSIRLGICRACTSLDVSRMVCQEGACGCYVERKAHWASEECPLQKWHRDEEHVVSGEAGKEQVHGPE